MTDNPQKDTLTTQHVKTLQDVVKQANKFIAAAEKVDAESVEDIVKERDAIDKRIGNLERVIAKLPLKDKAYVTTKTAVVALHKAAKKLATDMAKRPADKAVLMFGGTEMTEKQVIAKIKGALPSSGHGNISQSLNDVILGRGKATSGVSGVLHASAGPKQTGKGCTIFFKRGKDATDVVGVGQHVEVSKGQKPKYEIFYGSVSGLKKGKTIQL